MLSERDQLAVADGLRRGSRTAWTTLYDAYSADVWRYVARMLGHHASDVADVVQETFLAAAASAGTFDPARGSLWNWLTGIAHHHASARWRQRARAAERTVLPDEFHATVTPPEAGCLQREQAEAIRHVLNGLPAEYASLLTAKYLDDRSLEDLSREERISVEAVKSKLARARREFRARYDARVIVRENV